MEVVDTFTVCGEDYTAEEMQDLAQTGELFVFDPDWQPIPKDLFDQICNSRCDTVVYDDIDEYGQVVQEDVTQSELLKLCSHGYLYMATAVDQVTRVR